MHYGCGWAFHQQLRSPTPEGDNYIRLSVLMAAVTTRTGNRDGMAVVAVCGCPGDGIVIVAMYAFHAGVIVI